MKKSQVKYLVVIDYDGDETINLVDSLDKVKKLIIEDAQENSYDNTYKIYKVQETFAGHAKLVAEIVKASAVSDEDW